MKKYTIITAITATCLALCAAVWPQTEAFEETTRAAPSKRSKRPSADC